MNTVSVSISSPLFEKFWQAYLKHEEMTLILPTYDRPVRVTEMYSGDGEGEAGLVKFKIEEVNYEDDPGN